MLRVKNYLTNVAFYWEKKIKNDFSIIIVILLGYDKGSYTKPSKLRYPLSYSIHILYLTFLNFYRFYYSYVYCQCLFNPHNFTQVFSSKFEFRGLTVYLKFFFGSMNIHSPSWWWLKLKLRIHIEWMRDKLTHSLSIVLSDPLASIG
mgnify:FL=1